MSEIDEMIQSAKFQFGSVQETVHLKVYDGLPYNPFTFDIGLHIIKTIPPYENDLFFTITTGCRSVFGRKKADVQHVLSARTISSRHFMIDEQKKLTDLGSTRGTFVWINKDQPSDLQPNKMFIIGTTQIKVQEVSYNERKIWIKIKDEIIQINRHKSPFFFGEHKNCHYKINCKKEYIAYINAHTMKLHNFLQDQDCDQEKGVWERLSPTSIESEPRQIQSEDLIMAYPYIFRVQY